MTRQEAREWYGLRTIVYRKGFKPFEDDGLVKLLVHCPRTLRTEESDWVNHTQANAEFDRIVQQVVFIRQNIPPPPKPVRFHQLFDF